MSLSPSKKQMDPTVVNQPTFGSQNPPGYSQGMYSLCDVQPNVATGQNNMTVVVNQPQHVVKPSRIWSSNICDCGDDMGSCLLGTFCPCIMGFVLAMDMNESCCVPCCVPGWLHVLRAKMRAENNIQGSLMDDCLVISCCAPCVLCQMAREVNFVQRVQSCQ